MGLGQYNSLGKYCDPHTASSVFFILFFALKCFPFSPLETIVHLSSVCFSINKDVSSSFKTPSHSPSPTKEVIPRADQMRENRLPIKKNSLLGPGAM